MKNILLIGVGAHARRIYIPAFQKWGAKYNARLVCGVDLITEKESIENYLQDKGLDIKMYYLPREYDMSAESKKCLDDIIKENEIEGVIIATEPLVHMQYALWAIDNKLHILMDKPISTRFGVSTDVNEAKGLLVDYEVLMSKPRNKSFTLMAQRRFHPAFKIIKEKINEVYARVGCPVTAMQTFHSDGQWRMPDELIDINYHPFNQGYGKVSHSGYHSLDVIPWLMEGAGLEIVDNIDINTNFVRPLDYLAQFPIENYPKLFKNYQKHAKYDKETLDVAMKDFGEIDAFSTIAFRKGDKTISVASNSLVHNGFSQRGWLDVGDRDLYKGNGRVRQESHIIEQGAFQSITYLSYQGEEVDPSKEQNLYDFGGEYHLDIHVFRNNRLFPDWKNHEKISINDIDVRLMVGQSRGHQEDARLDCIFEFLRCVNGEVFQLQSSLEDHYWAVLLMSGIYQSASLKHRGLNSIVNLKV